MRYNINVAKYQISIYVTENNKEPFNIWFNSLDKFFQKRVLSRLIRIQNGNLGDYKQLDIDLYELRLDFGGGYRIYYTLNNNELIILLTGGDKSSQNKDIQKAKEYLAVYKNGGKDD